MFFVRFVNKMLRQIVGISIGKYFAHLIAYLFYTVMNLQKGQSKHPLISLFNTNCI